MLPAGIQALSKKNSAVEQNCIFPEIQNLAESRTAHVKQAWGLGTQTECGVGLGHCYERTQVLVLSWVLNVVAHPFA